MNQMEYKRLGDYIREVNVRNRELKVTKLVGLTIDKAFIPSVANVIGTDLSNYKVIRKEQFACSLMQVSRDGKIPVAMFEEDAAIMSPAYPMFEVIDKTQLLPQYLMMWFSRKDFDREASFYAVGGVRGSLSWEDFCNMRLPVPTLARQREIVAEYETLGRRIHLNEQMIARLEETAQALYRKMFVEGIDKENLPEGWNFSTLGEVFDITIGRTPPRAEEKWFCRETEKENNFPWVSIADMNNGMYILDTRERLTKEAVDWFKIPIVPPQSVLLSFKMTVGRVCITTETTLSNEAIAHFVFKDNTQIREYLYMFLKNIDYKTIGSTSSITEAINTNMIKTMLIIMPPDDVTQKFHEQMSPVFSAIYLKQQENEKLTELQSLLLARMGK